MRNILEKIEVCPRLENTKINGADLYYRERENEVYKDYITIEYIDSVLLAEFSSEQENIQLFYPGPNEERKLIEEIYNQIGETTEQKELVNLYNLLKYLIIYLDKKHRDIEPKPDYVEYYD